MTDFVLEQDLPQPIGRTAGQMVKFGLFLKQKLELWMFVPCKFVDGVWVVLDSYFYDQFNSGRLVTDEEMKEVEQYQEAKDRVLFEGFSLENKGEFTTWIQKDNHSICFTDRGKININSQNERTVEDVIKYKFILTLTAQKQIGL